MCKPYCTTYYSYLNYNEIWHAFIFFALLFFFANRCHVGFGFPHVMCSITWTQNYALVNDRMIGKYTDLHGKFGWKAAYCSFLVRLLSSLHEGNQLTCNNTTKDLSPCRCAPHISQSAIQDMFARKVLRIEPVGFRTTNICLFSWWKSNILWGVGCNQKHTQATI